MITYRIYEFGGCFLGTSSPVRPFQRAAIFARVQIGPRRRFLRTAEVDGSTCVRQMAATNIVGATKNSGQAGGHSHLIVPVFSA